MVWSNQNATFKNNFKDNLHLYLFFFMKQIHIEVLIL